MGSQISRLILLFFTAVLVVACESSETYRAELREAVREIQTFAVLADLSLSLGTRDDSYAEHKEQSGRLLAAVNRPPVAYQKAFELAAELHGIAARFDESSNAPVPMSELESRQLRARQEEINRQLDSLLTPPQERQ